MRVANQDLDHVGIFSAEISQSNLTLMESVMLERGNKAIKLLLLVALAVLFHDD